MKSELNLYFNNYINNLNCEPSLKKAMSYSLISDGKLYRPLVFFTFLKEFNIDYKKYLNIGCAIEMIHTYSLIHDDLPAMDDDDYRRNKLTSHKMFDEATAILTGDALLTHSFSEAINNDLLTSESKVDIINALVDCSGVNKGMINGQILDINNENNNCDENTLREIHIQKTSRLIELPIICALIVANKLQHKEKLVTLATNIGHLYQIIDDYLDYYGTNTGKDSKSDLKNNKITYVNFYSKKDLEDYINSLIKSSINVITELNLSDDIKKLVSDFGEKINDTNQS